MDTLSYKTISANKATVTKEWVIVDATDQTLGRLGAKVAKLLRGKYKPNFTPHVDCGDNVIIINADKVKLTGNKWNDRVYLSYTGYPGGQREMTPARLITKPNGEERLLKKVVKGMLPKNILGAKLLNNLCGGGFTGQSQALRLAIARALVKMNAEDKAALRAEGFMTRDPRSVERKKPGQPKARRRFQFSKR